MRLEKKKRRFEITLDQEYESTNKFKKISISLIKIIRIFALIFLPGNNDPLGWGYNFRIVA